MAGLAGRAEEAGQKQRQSKGTCGGGEEGFEVKEPRRSSEKS